MELDDIIVRCRLAIEELRVIAGDVPTERRPALARTISTLDAAIHAKPVRPAAFISDELHCEAADFR